MDFTKEQYDRLREFYSDMEIELMEPSFVKPLFEHLYDFTVEQETVYVQTFETVDEDGKVVTEEKETVLTEEQAEHLEKLDLDAIGSMERTPNATHETASKFITLKLALGPNTAQVTISCNWKKLPTVRSYDIMAFACSGFHYFWGANNFTAYVKGDGKITGSYNENSSEAKIKQGVGAGVSVKLPANATSSIYSFMQCSFAVPAGATVVNGTYQHCTSNISLSDSMKYNIKSSATSMGGVLDFTSSSVANKYDSTGGLSVSDFI